MKKGYKISRTFEVLDENGKLLHDNFYQDEIIPALSKSEAIKIADEKIDRLKTQMYGQAAVLKRKGRIIVHPFKSPSARRKIKSKMMRSREIKSKAMCQQAF